jgi:hypothetical protein
MSLVRGVIFLTTRFIAASDASRARSSPFTLHPSDEVEELLRRAIGSIAPGGPYQHLTFRHSFDGELCWSWSG